MDHEKVYRVGLQLLQKDVQMLRFQSLMPYQSVLLPNLLEERPRRKMNLLASSQALHNLSQSNALPVIGGVDPADSRIQTGGDDPALFLERRLGIISQRCDKGMTA